MDLALNNLKWLICHKTKPKTNANRCIGMHIGPLLKKTVLAELNKQQSMPNRKERWLQQKCCHWKHWKGS